MPDIEPFSPRGMFHEGWTADVNDFAIVCGWATNGKLFIFGDVAGGIFHTHNHLADARIEILVYLAVQEKVPTEIIFELSQLNNLEDALLLLERFNQSLTDKLFKNLSMTIEKRSSAYVNRYVKTDMEIASIIFDRKRKIRWAGIHGNKYISYFQ